VSLSVNRRQRAILIEFVLVLAATVAAVVGMANLKDYVNRSEAMRAMTQLGQRVLEYRRQHGSLPPESFIQSIKGDLEGAVRMGNVRYRAIHIGPGAPADTILAYSLKKHSFSFLQHGYVVLRLDGQVEWLPTSQLGLIRFERTLELKEWTC